MLLMLGAGSLMAALPSLLATRASSLARLRAS
jgi:hypothetical protein